MKNIFDNNSNEYIYVYKYLQTDFTYLLVKNIIQFLFFLSGDVKLRTMDINKWIILFVGVTINLFISPMKSCSADQQFQPQKPSRVSYLLIFMNIFEEKNIFFLICF